MSFNMPEIPKSASDFLNVTKEGEYTFRIIGSPLSGYSGWITGSDGKPKPVRQAEPFEPKQVQEFNANKFTGKKEQKFFLAFPVIDRDSGFVKILEISQRSILDGIDSLIKNKKWGDPTEYDITVTNSQDKGKVEYNVTPNPKEKLTKEDKMAIEARPYNLEALYEGENPFETAPSKSDEDLAKGF